MTRAAAARADGSARSGRGSSERSPSAGLPAGRYRRRSRRGERSRRCRSHRVGGDARPRAEVSANISMSRIGMLLPERGVTSGISLRQSAPRDSPKGAVATKASMARARPPRVRQPRAPSARAGCGAGGDPLGEIVAESADVDASGARPMRGVVPEGMLPATEEAFRASGCTASALREALETGWLPRWRTTSGVDFATFALNRIWSDVGKRPEGPARGAGRSGCRRQRATQRPERSRGLPVALEGGSPITISPRVPPRRSGRSVQSSPHPELSSGARRPSTGRAPRASAHGRSSGHGRCPHRSSGSRNMS